MKNFTETFDGFSLEIVKIPGGTFAMGSLECEGYYYEKPPHKVTVPSFFMGKFQVTQAQWRTIASRSDLKVERDLKPDPSHFKGDERPVENISWYDAVEFCQRLSRLTGREYRLPSEAEWEYACRAGTTTPFHFGETITKKLVNYDASETIPVGQFPPNTFGLYDMHGNVWEWCEDNWHDNYERAPVDGSAWTKGGDGNCSPLRGGSWVNPPEDCRSAIRTFDYRRVNRYYYYGFRVVCVNNKHTLFTTGPLKDGISKIDLINRMGDDLSVVNAARVSYDKQSFAMTERDIGLINYLIKHKHYSPLRGVVFTFRVKCPLFVARQWWKHAVSSSYTESQIQFNESSFRYITLDDPEFYIPKTFRVQSKTNKQSSEESTEIDDKVARLTYETACANSAANYKHLLELGVCREQARAVLVPAVYTSFIWTVSLQALLNFISLRTGEGAQSEIVMYAKTIRDIIHEYVPTVMEAWNKYEGNI